MISVIVPMYNDEKYIKSCLYSIISQSFKDIEIIVVNDGSQDSSLYIAQEIANKDKRIKIINRNNGGRSAARNTGIENSTGEFLLFVDADDELEKDAISKLYMAINKDDSDISIGAATVLYDVHSELKNNDKWYFSIRYRGVYDITDKLIEDIHCSAWGKIFRRSVIDRYNIRFPENLNFEDSYWHWAYLTSCNKISCINDVVYKYFRRKNSIMSLTFENKENIAIQHIYIVEKIYEFWETNNNLEKHYNTAKSLLETYFWFAIKHSQNYERVKIAYNATRIARKYCLYSEKDNIITDIYNGEYNFLFYGKEYDMYPDYLKVIQMISIFNKIFPKESRRRKLIYFMLRYSYRFIKKLWH